MTRTKKSSAGLTARSEAIRILGQVLHKRQNLATLWPTIMCDDPRDRDFIRLLVLTTLRHLGEIDAQLDTLLTKALPRKHYEVRHILQIAAAQLLYMDSPAHAVVDTAVTLTEQVNAPHMKGMVNGVLRNLLRKLESPNPDDHAPLQPSTPKWLWKSWLSHYGKATAERIRAAHTLSAPLDITLHADENSETWAEKLGGTLLPNGSIRLTEYGAIEQLSGFNEGKWWIQDMAATFPARLLGNVKGQNILDVCAAPGGKTLQLSSAGAHVTAIDRSAFRLQRMHENLARTHMVNNVTLINTDVLQWQPDSLADAILLDAPCSATGTIRRHPELPYIKTADDVKEMAALQSQILERMPDWLRAGGTLIYCSCSLQPEEGEMQISRFLTAHPEMELEPITAEMLGDSSLAECITTEGYLRTLPCYLSELAGMDGFFAARLRKKL